MSRNSTAFNVVSMKTAMNPVAQAVARKRLQDGIRDMLIDLYTLEAGSVQAGAYVTAAQCVTAGLGLAGLLGETQGVAELQAAHDCCSHAAATGFAWRPEDAATLDLGLNIAAQYVRATTPRQLQQVYQQMKETP